MEKNLKEKEVYISNIECILADLSGRVNEMEDKLCRCHEEDVEIVEVEDDNDPTSELSYETVTTLPWQSQDSLRTFPIGLFPSGT